MNEPSTVEPVRTRRGLGALIVLIGCGLACALPVVGGIAAGTVVDRVLDSPAWLGLLVALGAALTIVVVHRRAKRRSHGC